MHKEAKQQRKPFLGHLTNCGSCGCRPAPGRQNRDPLSEATIRPEAKRNMKSHHRRDQKNKQISMQTVNKIIRTTTYQHIERTIKRSQANSYVVRSDIN